MNNEIQVTEKMAKFIDWAQGLGEEEVRRRVRDKIIAVAEMPFEARVNEGIEFDIRLMPNDGIDQYHNGGDCNLCKRKNYCSTQCGANKALKKITTPYLYQMYLDENPEVAAQEAAERMTPEDVLKMVGAENDEQPVS